MTLNKKTPLVSVGLPVFNGEQYLAEAIQSILSQTLQDFELIISDNASTDSTPEIIARYAASDSRVRISRNETNIGVAKNFNRVFELSRGKYFRWAAYDDIMLPQFLERCVDGLEADPSLVAFHTGVVRVNEHGNEISRDAHCSIICSENPAKRFRAVIHKSEYPIWAVMRSDAIRKTSLHQCYPSSEVEFLADLVLLGRFAQSPEYLFKLRVHPDCYSIRPRTAAEHWSWWGQERLRSQYLLPWIGFTRQAKLVVRSNIGLFTKFRCLGSLASAVLEFVLSVGRRVLRRLKNGITGHGFAVEPQTQVRRTGPVV